MKVKCTCQNEYQDKKYGQGMRVTTPTIKGNSRCTVCGKEHTTGTPTKEKGKK